MHTLVSRGDTNAEIIQFVSSFNGFNPAPESKVKVC
jgi:hypothetical protein